MYGRICDTQCCLGYHTCLFCPHYRGDNVAGVVQTAEDTGDIDALSLFDTVHQFTHVGGNGVHTETVQTSVEHMRLNTCVVEKFTESPHRMVWVFAIEEVYLLRGTAVGLYASEATHLDDVRCNLFQLVFAWHVLTRSLPHVPINKT